MNTQSNTDNPFAAPQAPDQPTHHGDWQLPILCTGLRLWFFSLCTQLVIGLAFWFGNPSITDHLVTVLTTTAALISVVSFAASIYVYRSAPSGKPRRMAAAVLFFAGFTPVICQVVLPVVRWFFGVPFTHWIHIANPIIRYAFAFCLLIQFRLISIRLESRLAKRVAGPAILLNLAAVLLTLVFVLFFVFGLPTPYAGISTIKLAADEGFKLLSGYVAYLLMSHVRKLIDDR